MRIIAGKYKGKEIKTVDSKATRPTTAKVREAWASVVSGYFDFDLSGLRVLDAFAGSGALGLELLSRGAEAVIFCDKSPAAIKVLRHNLDNLGDDWALRHSQVLQRDMLHQHVPVPDLNGSLLQGSIANVTVEPGGQAYDVVILDPPYVVKPAALAHLLELPGLVSYEHASRSNYDDERIFATKTYGRIAISFLRSLF
ncbi:MAG: RsmD family RNA methyltransferase [Coriobacteriales bacterium]|jgi:16S rRNA (guanine966-N2)-methyltransferase|nr:RsmD family RNA methyltransferase [Coriobacteriales bacterium]